MTNEDDERLANFKELINGMDIDTFVTIDIEAIMMDYMAGKYEIKGTRIPWYARIVRFVLRLFRHRKPKRV